MTMRCSFFTCFWKSVCQNLVATYCTSNKGFVRLNADYSTFMKSSWWTRIVSTWQGHDSSTNVCIKIIIRNTNIKILMLSPFFHVKKIKETSFPSLWNSPFPTEKERSTERRVSQNVALVYSVVSCFDLAFLRKPEKLCKQRSTFGTVFISVLENNWLRPMIKWMYTLTVLL